LRNWRFTFVIAAACLMFGLVSTVLLPKESDPEVNIPYVSVTTVMSGASAEDMEEFVTDPIEDEIVGLQGLNIVTSTSSRGVSSVWLEFNIDEDVDSALLDVKDRVELAKSDLPGDANDPIVQKLNFTDYPILYLAVAGPYDVVQLKEYAEQMQQVIERSSGVSRVEVSGGREREIQVQVDKAKLDRFGLSLRQVTGAISTANSNTPVGSIESGGEKFSLRFEAGLDSAEDVAAVPITAIDEVPILVRDVAVVEDTYADISSVARMSQNGEPSNPSVIIAVYKVAGGNEIATVDGVWDRINDQKTEILPEGVEILTIEDNAEFIREDLIGLISNGLQTVAIVMVLLIIFLGWREALLPGFGIPLSFLITFAYLYMAGNSLNFLSLFSLILALGIIVDASIVVTQGIFAFRQQGMKARAAACATIRNYALPLTAGTLTTIFAFLPMILTSGMMGEYIKTIPITVTAVLLSSLFVGLAILPAIAAKLFKKFDPVDDGSEEPAVETKSDFRARLTNYITSRYTRILDSFLARPRLRKRFMWLVILAFVVSIAMPATGIIKTSMFPLEDFNRLAVYVDEPYGTPLETMDLRMLVVEEKLQADPDIKFYSLVIGSGNNEHQASINLRLTDKRKRSSLEIMDEYTVWFEEQGFADASIDHPSMGPPAGDPVQIRISGPEFSVLEPLADQLENVIKEHPGSRDVGRNVEETNGEFVMSIDRAKASVYGVSASDVAMTLRNAVYGVTATSVSDGDDDMDVVVRYDLDPLSSNESLDQVDFSTIENLTIATQAGDIPLSSIVTSTYEGSRASVEHYNGNRVVIVTANTLPGTEAFDIFTSVEEILPTLDVPSGYEIKMGGEQEDVEQSFRDMLMALIIGILMIAALLVWQFGSFRQPFFILITIPLALIGVFFGLFILGMPLSFPGVIGVVALAGIVVNNAIILIDRVNFNRKNGKEKIQAVREAAIARLQPILLTTVTTVLGILPVTLDSAGWGPLGVSIIFGLSFSTVLTLIVVPLLFIRFGEEGKTIETATCQ